MQKPSSERNIFSRIYSGAALAASGAAGSSFPRQAATQTGTKRRQTHMKSTRLTSAAARPARLLGVDVHQYT